MARLIKKAVRPRGLLLISRCIGSKMELHEVYHVRTNSVIRWAIEIVEFFNSTLPPNQGARELVGIEELPTNHPSLPLLKHNWHKTNLITIRNRGRLYDTYQCTYCGITGKLFELGGVIIEDGRKKRSCK